MDRDFLKKNRPVIPTIDLDLANSFEEQFQNETFRPILKLQDGILVGVFKQYLQNRKILIQAPTELLRKGLIKKHWNGDVTLKSLLRGLVIGHFTLKELEEYHTNEKGLNKRLNQLILQRLQSHQDEF